MELLCSSIPTNPNSLSFTTPFPTRFPNKSWNPKTTFRYRKPSKNPSFSIYFLSRNTTKFQAFAQFGRPTSRRNSLRKKLIEDQKVNPLIPSFDFQLLNTNIDDSESKLNSDNVKEKNFRNWVADDKVKDGEFSNEGGGDSVAGASELKESKGFGESVLLRKLESWIEQYKRDTEYWGIGSGQIFTVYQGSDGNVERVLVNEDEILRRSRIERWGLEGSPEVNLKILQAESLAKEMESGLDVIPWNSSVAKFVVQGEESGFLKTIRGFTLQPDFLPKLSRVGRLMVYVLIALWALKKLVGSGNKEEKYTELEKEMMRRKMKARQEKEVLEKGNLEVEVVQESSELPLVSFEKPYLDRKELMNSIVSAKSVNGKPALQDSSNSMTSKSSEFDFKVQEIKNMARKAREIEQMEQSLVGNDEKETQPVNDKLLDEMKVVEQHTEEGANTLTHPLEGDCRQAMGSDNTAVFGKLDSVNDEDIQSCSTLYGVSNDMQSGKHQKHSEENLDLADVAPLVDSKRANNSSVQVKPRVIVSVKEAREYLSKKCDKNEKLRIEPVQGSDANPRPQRDKNENQVGDMANNAFTYAILDGTSDCSPAKNASKDCSTKDKKLDAIMTDKPEESYEEVEGDEGDIIDDVQSPQCSLYDEGNGKISMTEPSKELENWIEENFGEFEPIVKKIGVGFRDNYMVSRKKEDQESSTNIAELGSKMDDDSELEWMKDDSLKEIVLQVQDNELGGRDPFYMMDVEDKVAFFKGLEKKVEKENQKLSKLHGWLHSNIENLDYGADGISIYDTPDKIIPRWKGPPIEKSPEFLNYFQEQRKAIYSDNAGISYPVQKDEKSIPQSNDYIPNSLSANDPRKRNKTDSKIVIEASDGSVRAGKKTGKEFWQHTKKWSQGFVDSYNAETDPEIKSTMKDTGKDLDRWITEKEIQEAAEFMDNMPEKSKQFMEKKLSKLKREMELFGPQAVVSKYREYAEVKEEDYLWWLDLPYVLCIELYTDDNEEQRIGFYSLEMAADLELEPKPYHIIGFEDTNDCKNLCYIIQAQMEMLGNGHAFVVPQPPKDVFRDAKANGFGVTVIRKGELQLHVDQTLEEVEEQITEIGSKIYHDKIMQERSMDVSSLMKGVFGFSGKPIRRKRPKKMMKDVTGFSGKATKRKRSKQMLKKPKEKER
ncbi:PREDICTED: uncharacterized protein LOC101313638 [Fragaria vesca subsp. vesca]|uniref:uncharacterized protein LOC101313638 n=1 Tax=Fragaria vesca subsp. vesca TaxID=101020 RepID=UPI0002C31089|nr:PREDICTED: uncharacterized protein LOC101313638 [Fragaria vesca subsp. vesca]